MRSYKITAKKGGNIPIYFFLFARVPKRETLVARNTSKKSVLIKTLILTEKNLHILYYNAYDGSGSEDILKRF